MARREPASPPELKGFSSRELIGTGGYADVFLYEQQMPNRDVAVKVMVADAVTGGSGREAFTAEANLMAKVSAHPYIVEIYQADISNDGRPYLVMQYYSGATYHDRAKNEQMTVDEVLRTGIRLSSAVETAHRAGIYHRDIKPANVLTNEYNHPGLTDFGIASAHGPGETEEGVSIPWAPPEALGEVAPDARSDVYSLAATIYNLLTGRSPFEIPGGDNTGAKLIERIERHPVPAIGRNDVPPSFERTLTNAMAKDPAHRPGSAAEFGRQLQAVESELKLSRTPLELAGESRSVRSRTAVVDDDSTRIKGVTELRAQPDVAIRGVQDAPSGEVGPRPQRRREGLLAEPEVADTVHRARSEGHSDLVPAAETSVDKRYLFAGAAVVTLIAIAGLAAVLGGGRDTTEDDADLDQFEVNDNLNLPVAVSPPSVLEVVATDNGDGSFTFSWQSPEPGVEFSVSEDGSAQSERISQTTLVSESECIEVVAIGENGLLSAPTRGCFG